MIVAIVSAYKEQVRKLTAIIKEKAEDCEFHTFDSGLSAYKFILNHNVDALFSSNCIRHMRVTEFIRLIRKNIPDCDITVMVCAANDENETVKTSFYYTIDDGKLMNSGANRILYEPLDEEVIGILSAIHTVIPTVS